jgi:PAS domain S-box-containing protein
MADLLTEEGHQVATADDGLEAIDLLQTSQPQVIFVDLVMPNIDGAALCRVIRTMPRHQKTYLVILSAIAAESPRFPSIPEANAFLAKGPFKTMRQHVLDALAEAQARDYSGAIQEIRGIDEVHARAITQELLDVKRHYEQVLAAMNEGIVEMRGRGRIVFANRRAVELIGREENVLLGRQFAEIFHEEYRQEFIRILEELSGDDEARQMVAELESRLVEIRIFDLDQRNDHSVAILVDITERRRYEVQLMEAQRLESIGTLAAGVAHDFNNLLMAIQGNTSLMLLGLNPSHPYYERLNDIDRHIESAKRLTHQLLGYARKGRYEITVFDMNELVRNTGETFARTRKHITVRYDLDENLLPIEADMAQVEQVLLNLYLNAGDAMPGGGELRVATTNVPHTAIGSSVFTPHPGQYVEVTVEDTGSGMSESTRQRIFEPFFTTKEMGRGTGMGLASVYGTIKGHGGYIQVESEEGRGTTFHIYLPATEAAIEAPVVAREQPTPIASGARILLVDDEDGVRSVARDMLQALGYNVITASNDQEAISRLEAEGDTIDMVILDVVMPGMGGSELYRRLRSIEPDVRVLISSGYSIQGEANRILQMGANGFIQKPFTMEALSRRIRRILGEGDMEE